MRCEQHGCSLVPTPGAPTGLTCPMCQGGRAPTGNLLLKQIDQLTTENKELKDRKKVYKDLYFAEKQNLIAADVENATLKEEVERIRNYGGVKCVACPECGCLTFTDKDGLGIGFRLCSQCSQEWWIDIDYTLTPRQRYDQLKFIAARLTEALEKASNGFEAAAKYINQDSSILADGGLLDMLGEVQRNIKQALTETGGKA